MHQPRALTAIGMMSGRKKYWQNSRTSCDSWFLGQRRTSPFSFQPGSRYLQRMTCSQLQSGCHDAINRRDRIKARQVHEAKYQWFQSMIQIFPQDSFNNCSIVPRPLCLNFYKSSRGSALPIDSSTQQKVHAAFSKPRIVPSSDTSLGSWQKKRNFSQPGSRTPITYVSHFVVKS